MKGKNDFPEEFLSGYLDAELSDSEMLQVENAIAEDPRLMRSFGELRRSNAEFSRFVQQSLPKEPLHLWKEIERQISPRRSRTQLDKIIDLIRFVFAHPSRVAAAGAFGVAMFTFGLLASRVSEPEHNLARNAESNSVLVPILSDGRQLSGSVRHVSGASPVKGFAPRFVSPQTLREDHPARNAGYSTDTVEIDWMKCPRSVKIIRSEDVRELPPVFWFGEGG